MKSLFNRLLDYYKLTESEYNKLQNEDESSLPSFDVFPKILDIVGYFKNAISTNKKIIIYGDYDCDGIMSTSIMMNLFLKDNYKAGFYIPSREFDGYGLTKENIDKFHALGYNIILCVDNGITLVEQVDYANSLGMEVVIFDHHTIQEVIPNAKYILHPSLSNIGKHNISAGEVCFYFSYAYLSSIDKYLLSLAAISTISDMMPLLEYNRMVVKLGLKYINEEKFDSIYNLIDKKYDTISEDNISLEIAPKVNSIGRLLNDNTRFNIVKYFLKNNGNNEARLRWINHINQERKELISEYSSKVEIDESADSIVTIIDKHEGIAGLIANSLLNKYNKPVVVFAFSQDKEFIKGSVRSRNGFNVVKALQSLSELIITFGGHECAGGLTIKTENFLKFQNAFNELAKTYSFKDEKKDELPIYISDLNLTDYSIYRSFAPFGEGHPRPTFLLNNFPVKSFISSKDDRHLFATPSATSKIVYFSYDKNVKNYHYIDILGDLTRNTFNGYSYIQFLVREYREKN